MRDYALIAAVTLAGPLFAAGAMVISRLLASRSPETAAKRAAYESGESPVGDARFPFKLGYYLFALAFLIFDVEALFLFPVAAAYRDAVARRIPGLSGWQAWAELAAFAAVLALGLAYAWRKKVLEWE